MARELNTTQQTNVEAGATRPIYLVEWQHSGSTEYLSCSGDVTYDSQAYTAGGLKLASIEDSRTATLLMPATAARVSEIQYNAWRGGVCKITAILAAPGDTPTYSSSDGLLVMDGVIESSSFSGETISVTVKNKYFRGALVPRFTFDDVTSIIPAVGSSSTWEDENYSYEQWLKTTAAIQKLVRPGVNPQVVGRQSTSQVNDFASGENTGYKLLSAQGASVPIVYGRASVPGFIFADGTDGSGNKFIGVAWCTACFQIEQVYINDALPPSSVNYKHYPGRVGQTVSPALQSYISSSPAFSDDMVLHLPGGDLPIAYSVFNIPSAAISGAPRFRAIIKGTMVADPSSSATSPYDDLVGFEYDFTGSPSYPGAFTVPDSADLEMVGEDWTYETEFDFTGTVTSPGSTYTLVCHGATASPETRSIQVDVVGDELLLYLSSDGSTWDIADGVSCGTITVSSPIVRQRLVIERSGVHYSTYLDGVTQSGTNNEASVFDSPSDWEIGECGGAQTWPGTIYTSRLTIGAYRYGSPHDAVTNSPFSDSGTYTAGVVYSEKPALAWKDLAENEYYGLGATTTGVEDAVAYGDSLLSTDDPRCRIGIVISDVRLVERWLDQLAMYANSLWFPEGADLKIVPDKKLDGTNGSGKELYTPTSPEFGSPLPTVTTEDGESYSVSITLDTASTTSPLTGISVEFAGTEVIATQTEPGTYGALVTASGTSNTVEVIEDVGFNGAWSGLSVKRTKREVTQWLPATLSVQGQPEGNKPNSVVVKYTVPNDASGAWDSKTFGVMNADAIAGDPIVLTTIDMPGLYRIQEASNKAIAALYRNDRKTSVSFISTDEAVVYQPGDVIDLVSSYRGVDCPVWIESNKTVSYGRHEIRGIIYRDNQFPDTAYDDEDHAGTFYEDEGYAEEPDAGGPPQCTYELLPGEFITAEDITPATQAMASTSDNWFSMGVNGSEIIVAYWRASIPTTKIWHSTDLGETWDEHEDTLLDGLSAVHKPSRWFYRNNKWYAICQTGAFYRKRLMVNTDDGGATFTIGDVLYADDYGTAYPGSDYLLANNRNPGNNVYFCRYTDSMGSASAPAYAVTGHYNQNGGDIFPLTNGWFSIIWNGVTHDSYYIDWDCTTATERSMNNLGADYQQTASNLVDTVIVPDGTDMLRWTPTHTNNTDADTSTFTGQTGSITQLLYASRKGNVWFAIERNKRDDGIGDFGYLRQFHSEDSDAAEFTYSAEITLPSARSSSGTDLPRMQGWAPATKGWWVYAYVNSSSEIVVCKWDKGTYSGSCD